MEPAMIAMKAINGAQLAASERAALTPELLVQLAIGGQLTLSEAERARVSASQLSQLAIGEYVILTPNEIRRLPDALRTQLEIGGYISPNSSSVEQSGAPASSPSGPTSLEPTNEHERAVHSAFILLRNDRENLRLSSAQLATVCRGAPKYSLDFIDRHRIILLHASGSHSAEIAHMIRNVEWQWRGATKFIEYHRLDGSEDTGFILERLTNDPSDFTRDDLHSLLGYFKVADHPIRIAALQALAKFVTSFADRLAEEPPGLSQDVESLKQSVCNYGFTPDLNAILQKIDDDLQTDADAFDQAATIRHIRSFFEKLHECVGHELQRCKPNVGNGTPLGKCGQAIDYLERKAVITAKVKELGRCLYAILSDGRFGVHALKADRDYTRLCRNMVVEYAVTLFFELERRLATPGDT